MSRSYRIAAFVMFCGCSSPTVGADAGDAGVDAATDVSLADVAAPDAEAGVIDAGCDACTCIVDTAPTVSITHAKDPNCNPPPAATGGVIASGTYYLTAATLYDCCIVGFDDNYDPIFCADPGIDVSATLAFDTDAGTIASVRGNDRRAFTFSTSAASATIDQTCPYAATQTVGYSVDAGRLTLYASDTTGAIYVEQLTVQ